MGRDDSGPSEDVVGQVRAKIPPLALVEKKKERGISDSLTASFASETDGLGMEIDGPASSLGEARPYAYLVFGIGLQERVAKRGRSATGAPPRPPSHTSNPADINSMVQLILCSSRGA